MGTLSVSKWHVGVRVCLCVYRWTHCLLSRVGSLVWQGSDRSRIGWNSSPCALQMLVKWRDGHTHTHATPHDPHRLWAAAHSVHSNTPTTICPLLHLNHTHRSKIDQSTQLLFYWLQWCKTVNHPPYKHTNIPNIHMRMLTYIRKAVHHMRKQKHTKQTKMELCVHSYCIFTHRLTLCFHSSAAHHS